MKKLLLLIFASLFIGVLTTLCACEFSTGNGNGGSGNNPNHQHRYGDYIIENAYHYRECSLCGEPTTYDNHSFNGGNTCSVCNFSCNHPLSDNWVSAYEEGHFHAASCGHREFDGDKQQHSMVEFAEDRMICELCDYVHYHEYGQAWSIDDESHWHAALCEHSQLQLFKSEHDYNSNYRCRTCNYQHEHSFDTSDWTKDENGHFYSAKCGHDVQQSFAKHNYDTYTYNCKTCGYHHDHTNSASWTKYDDTYHWHAATCGHSSFGTDLTEHNYEYSSSSYRDTCTDCGYYRSHKHVYNGYETDNDRHWRICALCGAQDNYGIKTYHDYDESYKCNTCGYQHVHEFDTELSWNNDYHYYAAHCSHVRVEYVAHDYDEDYKCNSCGAQHVHTTQTTYTADNYYHWYEITCAHDVEPEKLQHNLEYNIGAYFGKYVCKDCNWIHEHTFDYDTWVAGVSTHYHPGTCGHGERIGEQPHNYVDDECTVCKGATELEFEYLPAQQEYIVKSIGTRQGGSVVISSTWNNRPVVGIAENAFKNVDFLVEITMPDSVTSIGAYAFGGCTSLQSVRLSINLTTLSAHCFDGCSSLQTISLPTGITTLQDYCFDGCESLTEIVLPQTVTTIGDGAFYGCGITEIDIPTAVTRIPGSLLYKCSALRRVTIGNGVTEIGGYAFAYTAIEGIDLPNGLLTIGEYAFRNCSNLVDVVVPDSVTSMGERVFYDCASLLSAELGNGITRLETSTFNGCTQLQTVIFGALIKTVGCYAFGSGQSMTTLVLKGDWAQFSALEYDIDQYNVDKSIANPLRYVSTVYVGDAIVGGDLVLPNDVTLIKTNAFYKCNAFDSITLPDGEVTIEYQAFIYSGFTRVNLGNGHITWKNGKYASYGNKAFEDCAKLQTLTMGDNITEIGAYAFKGCTALSSVTLGNGLQVIGEYAFDGLDKFDVTLPDSLVEIGDYAFRNCTSITSVNFGANLTKIGAYAFYNCAQIPSVEFCNKLTYIGNYAFYGLNMLDTLVIPSSVAYIGGSSFEGCTGLNSVTVGDDDTSLSQSIYSRAFAFCYVSTVTLGKSVTYIGSEAFVRADVTELEIPSRVTHIGSGAFALCYRLAKLTVPFVGSGDGQDTGLSYWFTINTTVYKSDVLTHLVVYGGTIAANAFDGFDSIGELDLTGVQNIEHSGLVGLENLANLTLQTIDTRLTYLFGGEKSSAVIPATLTIVRVIEGVIAPYAFYEVTFDGEIILDESVREIGSYAFAYCNLRSTHSLTLPYGVEKIDSYAFYDIRISDIYLPASVKYIGAKAFYRTEEIGIHYLNFQCTWNDWYAIDFEDSSANPFSKSASSYTNDEIQIFGIYIDGKLIDFGRSDKFIIPNGITRIGNYSICSEYAVTIEIPTTVTEIRPYAFEGCPRLEQITLFGNIASEIFCVEQGILYNKQQGEIVCVPTRFSYAAVTVPDWVVAIKDYAFVNNSDHMRTVQEIVLPDSVVSIGEFAFCNLTSLEKITFGSGLQTIGICAFENCTALTEILLPANVVSIGRGAFGYCYNLQIVKLNEGLTLIDENAFFATPALKHVIIPDSVTAIGRDAFAFSGLKSIVIGRGVTTLSFAFISSNSLTDVYYRGTEDEWRQLQSSGLYYKTIYYYSQTAPDPGARNLYWYYDDNGDIAIWNS